MSIPKNLRTLKTNFEKADGLGMSFGEEKFRVLFKNKVADEKKLVQRGKFETMTIGR